MGTTALTQWWDASRDFSTNTNPNGVWSYAWSEGLTGPSIRFTRAHVPRVNNNQEEMWDDPANSLGFTPSVARNAGGDYDDGNVTFRAGALLLHGGGVNGTAYAQVIWTAPQAGHYRVSGRFYAQQNEISVDIHVLLNGRPVFSDAITANGVSRSFAQQVTLSAGDAIAFSVGLNHWYVLHPGNTGLEATVERICTIPSIRSSEVEICWPSESNVLYQVEFRSKLTGEAWLPLFTNLVGTGETMCVTDKIAPGQPQRFYRVECTRP